MPKLELLTATCLFLSYIYTHTKLFLWSFRSMNADIFTLTNRWGLFYQFCQQHLVFTKPSNCLFKLVLLHARLLGISHQCILFHQLWAAMFYLCALIFWNGEMLKPHLILISCICHICQVCLLFKLLQQKRSCLALMSLIILINIFHICGK